MKHPVDDESAASTVSLAMKVEGIELLGGEDVIGGRPLPFLLLLLPFPFLPLNKDGG